MRKILLTLAFDGTNYHGWQRQRSGRGVCNSLERAWLQLCGCAPEMVASSRTDTGVHARAMGVHVEVPAIWHHKSPAQILQALNACLADDVRIVEVVDVPWGFHARFDAIGKEYRYTIWNHAVMNPLLRQQAWHVPQKLDDAQMKMAAKCFLGKNDFRAFTSKRDGVLGDSVRDMRRCELHRDEAKLTVILEASGFLYKMCRCIVGTLIQVGRGHLTVDDVQALLTGGQRSMAGMNAPAQGLCLCKVQWREELKEDIGK